MTRRMADSPDRRRVLILTSNFPRWKGDSTTPFVLHIAQDLQDLGWQVDVLAPHAEGAARSEVLEGVRVERFRYMWPDRAQTVCYQGGALLNLARDRTNILKLPFLVFAEWFATMRRLGRRDYAILHSHWILPQGFVAVLCAKLLRVPHVTTVHGGDIFGLRHGAMQAFKRFTLRHADSVTVNSSVTRKETERIQPHLKDINTIPIGINEQEPNPDRVAELRWRYRSGEGPLLIFVGRIVMEKGIEDFIRAIDLLRKQMPDLRALVVGEGPESGGMKALTQELGLGECITFAGWVDSCDVQNHIAAADVFVGPSCRARNGQVEAQGLTFVEAMMARTPVVASRSGGIVDSVHHEDTGLLVDERNPEQIAQAVIRIANDIELSERLIDNGERLVREKFLRSSTARGFSELFDQVIERQ